MIGLSELNDEGQRWHDAYDERVSEAKKRRNNGKATQDDLELLASHDAYDERVAMEKVHEMYNTTGVRVFTATDFEEQ